MQPYLICNKDVNVIYVSALPCKSPETFSDDVHPCYFFYEHDLRICNLNGTHMALSQAQTKCEATNGRLSRFGTYSNETELMNWIKFQDRHSDFTEIRTALMFSAGGGNKTFFANDKGKCITTLIWVFQTKFLMLY